MKYIRQFTIILLISLTGEILNHLIPFPVPASIYGMIILFVLLVSGVLKVDSIREVSSFLIEIMPVMFVPATAGLMNSFGLLRASLLSYAVITVVSTSAVMIISGRVAQHMIRRTEEENKHV